MEQDDLKTLQHYAELARRKKNPALKFACGVGCDLFVSVLRLDALGFAEMEVLGEDDPRPIVFFSITDEGRAALLPPAPTPEPTPEPTDAPAPAPAIELEASEIDLIRKALDAYQTTIDTPFIVGKLDAFEREKGWKTEETLTPNPKE